MEQTRNKMTKTEYKKIINEAIKEDIKIYLNKEELKNINTLEQLKEFKNTFAYYGDMIYFLETRVVL